MALYHPVKNRDGVSSRSDPMNVKQRRSIANQGGGEETH